MEATPNPNDESPKTDGGTPAVRLRVEIYDALAEKQGLTKIADQARKHRIGRQHMSDLKAGRKGASLELAMQMSADLGTTVEALFGRVPSGGVTS